MTSRRQAIGGITAAVGSLLIGPPSAWAAKTSEILRSCEAIHQEPDFRAPPERVYRALTDANQFDQVTQLSAAVKSKTKLGDKPTQIGPEPGATFCLFGGHIIGLHVELVPNERIVQAWRVVAWDPGAYSIVRFVLSDHAGGTRITFDHTGFPQGQAEHLAEGWNANYWEPLRQFLG